jgi:hypothetical protein
VHWPMRRHLETERIKTNAQLCFSRKGLISARSHGLSQLLKNFAPEERGTYSAEVCAIATLLHELRRSSTRVGDRSRFRADDSERFTSLRSFSFTVSRAQFAERWCRLSRSRWAPEEPQAKPSRIGARLWATAAGPPVRIHAASRNGPNPICT